MSEQGKLILFSGPSGVGKDTLLDILIRKNPNFQKSISITTRERREGEVDGVDYYFITPDDFEAMLDCGFGICQIREKSVRYTQKARG